MSELSLQTKAWIVEQDPQFIETVRLARQKNCQLVMVIDNYKEAYDLLYACLWYAAEQGVIVMVSPRSLLSSLPRVDRKAVYWSDSSRSKM